jgi:hypothetical protein
MTWEYFIYPIPSNLDVAHSALNRYGAQGWELVSVAGGTAFFKRPVEAGR